VKVLHEHRDHKGIRLHKVEDDHGQQGWMIRVSTPHARLSPGGRYKYTCPYCGRYIKARGQRCRDCICDALYGRDRWTWVREEIARQATRKGERCTEKMSRDIEIEMIQTMAMI